MTETLQKKYNWILNLILGVFVFIIIILAYLFFVKLSIAPGLDEEKNSEDDYHQVSEKITESDNIATSENIKPGEKIFMPILNFHHIAEAPANVSKTNASYYVKPLEFEKLLDELEVAEYEFYFVSELVNFLEHGIQPPQKAIALTFDDGNINFYTNAWPILRERKIKSNIYIMTGVGGDKYMNKSQIIEVVKDGFVEAGSHTVWHPKLTQINADDRLKELENSKNDLEMIISQSIEIICYPFGLYNEEVKAAAQSVGYKAGLTFDQDAWQDPADLFELKRISVWPGLNIISFLDKIKNKKGF